MNTVRWVRGGLVLGVMVSVASCAAFLAPPAGNPFVSISTWSSPGLDQRPLGRVVALPFTAEDGGDVGETVRQAFAVALGRRGTGEVSLLGTGDLAVGQEPSPEWVAALPRDVLIDLHRQGAQTVLVGHVSYVRFYGEWALGVRMTLVNCFDGSTLWITDDVIDTRRPEVRDALTVFVQLEGGVPVDLDPRHISFAQFTRFATESMAETLIPTQALPPEEAPPSPEVEEPFDSDRRAFDRG